MINQIKTIAFLGALSAILIALGGVVAPGNLYLFVGIALVMNLGAYFFSDKLVLRMHRAKEVTASESPNLHRMVAELAQRAQLPKPRIYVIAEMQPNAFATGRNPQHGVVAVTQGLLQLLSEREVRGVLAHELAHIKNRDILIASIAAAIASAISFLGNALQFGAIFGGHRSDDEEGSSPLGMLAMAIVAPMAATLVQFGISRSREFLADASAARMGGDPEGLASALAKLQRGAETFPMDATPATASLFIVSPLTGGGFTKLFSTHPPLEERIARLRAMARSSAFAYEISA